MRLLTDQRAAPRRSWWRRRAWCARPAVRVKLAEADSDCNATSPVRTGFPPTLLADCVERRRRAQVLWPSRSCHFAAGSRPSRTRSRPGPLRPGEAGRGAMARWAALKITGRPFTNGTLGDRVEIEPHSDRDIHWREGAEQEPRVYEREKPGRGAVTGEWRGLEITAEDLARLKEHIQGLPESENAPATPAPPVALAEVAVSEPEAAQPVPVVPAEAGGARAGSHSTRRHRTDRRQRRKRYGRSSSTTSKTAQSKGECPTWTKRCISCTRSTRPYSEINPRPL